MAQQHQDGTYYLTEGLLIEAYPDTTPTARPGAGGGGRGSGGWGLNQGPRRGEGGTGRFRGEGIPGFNTVIMEEHAGFSAIVDAEYAPRYSSLDTTIQTQINDAKQQLSKTANDALQRSKLEHQALLKFVADKQAEYIQQANVAYAFWGTSPLYKPSFFLALSAQEAVKKGSLDTFFQDFMKAYGATHESQIIDRTLSAALTQLTATANAVDQQEDLTPLDYQAKAAALAEKAQRIRNEQQAHFHALPSALQAEVIKWSEHIQGMASVEALKNYQTVLQNLINNQNASIRPFSRVNPNITAPLTRTELEALASLVEGQQSGIIGPRWKDHHLALLHGEYARHLQNTLTAFSALQRRAEQFNQQLEQANAVEAARRLIEQQEQDAALRAEAQRRTGVTYSSLASATTLPFMAPMGGGSFTLGPAAYGALQTAIRIAIPALRVATLASPPALLATLVVGALVILWPKEKIPPQTIVSIPLADLSPPEGLDLTTAGTSVQLPYVPVALESDAQTALAIVSTTNAPAAGKVSVVAAQFDAQQQVYSVALKNPERILTWTPVVAPGGGPASTHLPEHRPEAAVYEGASLTPVEAQVESYPALDLIDQDRIIVTFPAASGMAPILVMFKSRRFMPGVVTGKGQPIEGIWLGEATRGSGSAIPSHIADQFRGKEFKTFDDFREVFWKAVANDEQLSQQFSTRNLKLMKLHGHAPGALKETHHKSHVKFVLHHVIPISEGGGVYDLDNIRVVTPSSHHHIHYGDKP